MRDARADNAVSRGVFGRPVRGQSQYTGPRTELAGKRERLRKPGLAPEDSALRRQRSDHELETPRDRGKRCLRSPALGTVVQPRFRRSDGDPVVRLCGGGASWVLE